MNFYAIYRTIIEKAQGNKYILQELEHKILNDKFLLEQFKQEGELKVLAESKRLYLENNLYKQEMLSSNQRLLEYFNMNPQDVIATDIEKQINEMLFSNSPKKVRVRKALMEKAQRQLKELTNKELKQLSLVKLNENAFFKRVNLIVEKNSKVLKSDKNFLIACGKTIKESFKKDKLQAIKKLALLEEVIKDKNSTIYKIDDVNSISNIIGMNYDNSQVLSYAATITLNLNETSFSLIQNNSKVLIDKNFLIEEMLEQTLVDMNSLVSSAKVIVDLNPNTFQPGDKRIFSIAIDLNLNQFTTLNIEVFIEHISSIIDEKFSKIINSIIK
jgi:hypothetical protein